SVRRPIQIEYLTGQPFDEVIARVSALRGHTVALLGAFVQDSTGRNFNGAEVASRVATAAKVPVYTLVEQMIGTGAVGGRVVSFEAQGRTAAQLALRVLRGEQPPPLDSDENVYMFDARALRRWGLDRRQLPAGSVLVFDQPSLWRLYREYIVAAAVLLG